MIIPIEHVPVVVLVLVLFICLSCPVPCFEEQLMGLQINSSLKRWCLGVCFLFCTTSSFSYLSATQPTLQKSFISPYFSLSEGWGKVVAPPFSFHSLFHLDFSLRLCLSPVPCLMPWIINIYVDMDTGSWLRMASYRFKSLYLMYG